MAEIIDYSTIPDTNPDLVDCNHCDSKMYVDYDVCTCPHCGTVGMLMDIEEDELNS